MAFPGTTQLLSALVTIPPGANAAVVQGVGDGVFAYRMDGTEGVAAAACLTGNTVPLRNRGMINGMVVAANGGATSMVVQFYTGSSGQ